MIRTEILSDPALLFLYHRVEQILGIKTTLESLVKLKKHLEDCCGASFIENPGAHESMLTSREQIYDLAKMLTVNETYFFREETHFDILARFLPQMTGLKRPIQICSAATSIGCEAYSIAMLIDYHLHNGPAEIRNLDYEIDAFDVNSESIAAAKNALYTPSTLRTDGSSLKYILDLYLVPHDGIYTVTHNIRRKVRFFSHNIMRGMGKKYDIIFFRNTLIYFSSKNRIVVLHDIAESLTDNGLLFLGISETSSVQHPLLAGRCESDTFYFQKSREQSADPFVYRPSPPLKKQTPVSEASLTELAADCGTIKTALEQDEGKANAEQVMKLLAENNHSLNGAQLAAAAVYFLGIQNFSSADQVLSYLEKGNTGAPVRFLRGEYHLLNGNTDAAVHCFENAAGKDRTFWPAFYRLALLAADDNPVRYEYRIKKACESIELGRELQYECFMGGFSPDYFNRILEKKLM